MNVAQSCWTLCDPTDCSPPGSSARGDSPGKNTGVGSHPLLQEIFPTQGSNLGLPHGRQILYHLSHWGSPEQLLPPSRAPLTGTPRARGGLEPQDLPLRSPGLRGHTPVPTHRHGRASWLPPALTKVDHPPPPGPLPLQSSIPSSFGGNTSWPIVTCGLDRACLPIQPRAFLPLLDTSAWRVKKAAAQSVSLNTWDTASPRGQPLSPRPRPSPWPEVLRTV